MIHVHLKVMEDAPPRKQQIEVRRASGYEKRARKLLKDSQGEQGEMESAITAHADAYPVVPETGGFRKARWALAGKGKSGGVRVIYFFVAVPGLIFFADIYSKNEKANLSADDKKALRGIATLLKAEIKEKTNG